MRHILLIVFMVIPALAVADERMDKIATLVKAQGLLGMWQQQIDSGRLEGEKQAHSMIEQAMLHLSPDEQYKKRFEQALTHFIEKAQGDWTAEQIVEVWAQYYGPKFSDRELDQLIAFYTSEVGQKDIAATKETLAEFTLHVQKRNQPIMEGAFKGYVSELKTIAKECMCPKKD